MSLIYDTLLRILVEQFSFYRYARVSVAFGLEGVQPDFLQLALTQTWVKCTSLDFSRCVVYSGIKIAAIRAASKKLKHNEWWKGWFDSGHFFFSYIVCIDFFNFSYG